MAARSIGVVVDHNVPVPMRDGTLLSADVHRPSAPGRHPTLVERVTYELTWRVQDDAERYGRAGYVLVAQSVRGASWSGGRFAPGRDDGWGEGRDGYGTVEWAAAQPWSSGAVGMLDGSYSGATQYPAAPTAEG